MLREVFPLLVAVTAATQCNTWTECFACTSAPSWLPGADCRWCPDDLQCHQLLSSLDPCPRSEVVDDHKKCPAPGERHDYPPVPDNEKDLFWVKAALKALFMMLKIKDVDVSTCVSDYTGATVFFEDFATDVKSKYYSGAVLDLSRGISSLSRSTSDCGVLEVQQKLDALAASVRWANITLFDDAVRVLVDASDLWKDLEALATAILSKDPSAVGQKIGTLLGDWSALTGGCGDHPACKLIDGLLRVLQVTANDVRPCEAALVPVITKFKDGADAFERKDYNVSISNFADGLEALAHAASSDSCGLKLIADAIGDLSPKLKAAIVKAEGSNVIKIMVGVADIYQELYALVSDLSKGDFAGAGVQLGALLSKLRASSCQTNACIIVEGMLAILQVGFVDYTQCLHDWDATWNTFENFFRAIETKQWHDALVNLGNVLGDLSTSMSGCGLQKIGSVLEETAKRLHADGIATEIGTVVRFLVSGSDISTDLSKIMLDYGHQNWQALGRDLGGLSDWITSNVVCSSIVCRLVEGVLEELDVSLTDLKSCEDELRKAEGSFIMGVSLWSSGHEENAIKSWAAGLNQISRSVGECDLSKHLAFIEQEANLLGLGNFTLLDDVTKWLVHGSDFYEELYGALGDIQKGDYRAAGAKMISVINDISKWTTGHLCTSPVCYIVSGGLQYLSDLEQDFPKCEADFETAWDDFGQAFEDLSGHESVFSAFSPELKDVNRGIGELGYGLKAVASSVTDCHLAEFAEIIGALAAKLGMPSVFSWVEKFLHILINGVKIEKEIANACIDFSAHDWPGFGYNLIALTKTLLTDAERAEQHASQKIGFYV